MNRFRWLPEFEIHNELVDSQHQHLFELVNRLATTLDSSCARVEDLESLVDQFLDYCERHFEDEERVMAEAGVDDRHRRMQAMEHSSFTYDICRLRNAGPDESVQERFERLVTTAGAWLVFHTLRLDQQLGVQLQSIAQGVSPEEAYEMALMTDFGTKLNRKVTEALIALWAAATKRAQELESELEHGRNAIADPIPAIVWKTPLAVARP